MFRDLFILSIFMEIQVCENERISECVKILNTISSKMRLKKGVCFYLKEQKKSHKDFCNENLTKNDPYSDENQSVSNAAVESFLRHWWYLNEHLIGLVLFDPDGSNDIKVKRISA